MRRSWKDGSEKPKMEVCPHISFELLLLLLVAAVVLANIAIEFIARWRNPPIGVQGFISSLAHPGGNITGLTSFEFEIGGKWLQLLKEIVPDLSRVSVIYNPEAGPYAINFIRSMTAIGPGANLIATPIRNISEIESAVASTATGSKAGLIVNPDGFMIANHNLIVSVAARFRLPAIYPYGYFAAAGGLLSYGHPTVDVFRQGAVYIDKILHGCQASRSGS